MDNLWEKLVLPEEEGPAIMTNFTPPLLYDAFGDLADLTLLLRFLYQDQFTQRPTADLIIQITHSLNTDLLPHSSDSFNVRNNSFLS